MTKRENAVQSVFRCGTLTLELYTKRWIELIPTLDRRLRDAGAKNAEECCSVQELQDGEVGRK